MRRWLCVPERETLRILRVVEGLLCVPELRPERSLEKGFVLCVLGLKSLIVWGCILGYEASRLLCGCLDPSVRWELM